MGECDFVTEIAARLPLVIICDMMGIPESQQDFVIEKSNAIIGVAGGDPEFVTDPSEMIPGILTQLPEVILEWPLRSCLARMISVPMRLRFELSPRINVQLGLTAASDALPLFSRRKG